jgi:capsid protein
LSYNPKLDNPVKLNLMTIEADRISAEYENLLDDTDVDGIRYDAYGNPVSYRVLRYHPNQLGAGYIDDAFQVDADHMLHTFVKLRSGQHRGIPELTPALEQFAQLRRYGLAELSAAETMADLAGVLYTDSPAGGESAIVDPLETIPFERNMLMSLPAGWKIGSPDSKHPTSNHSSFVKVNLAEIARSVCATYGTISGDFSGFNYASGRLDNQIYQKSIIVDRTNWEHDVLNRVFKAWMREWSLVNMVDIPADAPHTWFWDGFLHVDPTKQANATKTELETLATNLPDVYAAKGQDYRIALKKISQTVKMCKEMGIPIEVLYPKLANQQTSAEPPQADDTDDTGDE